MLHRFFLIIALLVASPAMAQTRAEIQRDGQVVTSLTLEIASTPIQKSRGLMFRDNLPEGHGMWFSYEPPIPAKMWMKNTLIPLDMLFISRDSRIIHIHPMAIPHDLTPIGPSRPVAAVLEIGGGQAKARGIRIDDTIQLIQDNTP
jgi:uncharacterized protein